MRRLLLAAVACVAASAQPIPLPPPNYCFGFLNAVPDRPELSKEEALSIQKAHLEHLGALADRRWLVAAGPIVTPGGPRGIVISRCASLEEALELHLADPAVLSRRLLVEMYRWSGPPGIGDGYRKAKAENPGGSDRMVKHAVVLLRRSPAGTGWPAKEVLAEHFAHVLSLRKTGALVAAGPFHDAGDRIGVLVFQGPPLEEARRLAEQDPLVRGGHGRVEAWEWLCAEGVFAR